MLSRLLVALAAAVAVPAAAWGGPADGSETGSVARPGLVAHSSATADGAGPAPVGTSAVGTWWSPGADSFTASSLWVFDPVDEEIPYGWRTDYQPTGTVTPFGTQFSFVYGQSGTTSELSFPTGTRQKVTVLAYDEAADVLTVDWEGYRQTWVGCDSGRMPPVAAAACR